MAHHGGRGLTKTAQIRKERRERAERVAEETGWSKLSIDEKLARLPEGGANKQRARLLKQKEELEKKAAEKVAEKEVERAKKEAKEAKVESPKKKSSKK